MFQMILLNLAKILINLDCLLIISKYNYRFIYWLKYILTCLYGSSEKLYSFKYCINFG